MGKISAYYGIIDVICAMSKVKKLSLSSFFSVSSLVAYMPCVIWIFFSGFLQNHSVTTPDPCALLLAFGHDRVELAGDRSRRLPGQEDHPLGAGDRGAGVQEFWTGPSNQEQERT